MTSSTQGTLGTYNLRSVDLCQTQILEYIVDFERVVCRRGIGDGEERKREKRKAEGEGEGEENVVGICVKAMLSLYIRHHNSTTCKCCFESFDTYLASLPTAPPPLTNTTRLPPPSPPFFPNSPHNHNHTPHIINNEVVGQCLYTQELSTGTRTG